VRTVEAHGRSIFHKLHLHGRSELVVRVMREEAGS
jgi:DNA-binding CsgD family transcriptional regulator